MMFCKQCGASIPDGSSFCTSCGAPVSQQPNATGQQVQNPVAQQPNFVGQQVQNPYAHQPNANGQQVQNPSVQQPYAAVQAAQPKSRKKLFIILGSAGAVVIIAIVLILIFSAFGGSSCSAVVNNLANGATKGDIDLIISTIPPDVVAYETKEHYDGDYEEFKEKTLNGLGSFAGLTYLANVEVSCTIVDEKHCSDSASLREVNETYRERYDATNAITELAKCEVSTSVVYDGFGTPSQEPTTMYFVKINGQWYLDDSGAVSSISSIYFN